MRALDRRPLVEVGAHTVTHPALTTLPLAAQAVEIRQSKRSLEQLVNHDVSGFSYPHGDHDPTTVSAVRAAGFTSACTSAPRTVSRQAEPLALPRFQVFDWSGDEFRAHLQAWQNGAA